MWLHLFIVDILTVYITNKMHRILISDQMAGSLDEKFDSLESILAEHLPADVLEKVNLSLRGPGSV